MTDPRPVVCQLVHTLNVGGAEVLAGNLARRLRDRYRFVFLCLDELGPGAERLRDEGFSVEVVGRRAGLDWRCPLRLAAAWRRDGVELVQAHQYTPFFYALLGRLLGVRLRHRRPTIVFTEHGRHFPDYPRTKRKIANRLLLGRRDRVVAVGRSVKTALVENEGIAAPRIEVIPNGIDTDRFASSSALRAEVRAELGIAPNDFLVLMVARLDPIKDHATAIRACARAAAAVSGLRLVLVGDGPERPAIESLIRAENLGNRVRLLGTRNDVPRLLTGADTLLLTSVSEGIPLTVIEAMATGVPVVSTNVGSVADVVTHWGSGLLAPARDEATLALHLMTLGGTPLLRIAMGDRGRARAVAEFSETVMADRYADLFDAALGRVAPRTGEAAHVVC
jgi:glycosyltransferase involved in cell wall biosynthesis